MKLAPALLAFALASTTPLQAQSTVDFASIDAVMDELYASVTREPGAPFEWDRLRAVMLPGAIMLPQRAQTQGAHTMMGVEDFISWVDGAWDGLIGTEQDLGFYERQTNLIVEEFGDVAHVWTTYEKGPWEPRQITGRGINSVQLVKRDERWYVLSITWDEENTAGPMPERYRGS